MSGISSVQLEELTTLVNERAAEFGGVLPIFERGWIRLILAVMEEWNFADDPPEPITGEWQRGYEEGYAEAEAVAAAKRAGDRSRDEAAYVAGVSGVPVPDSLARPVGNGATGIADDGWCGDDDDQRDLLADGISDIMVGIMATVAPEQPSSPWLGGRSDLVAPLIPRRPGRDRLPDPDVARANVANMLANGSGGQLAALTTRKPRTLAEADSAVRRMGKGGTFLPTLDEFVRELKRQSMAGMMPSQSQFNDAKPANWAIAAAQTQRLKKSWEELAELSGLKLRQRGPQPQATVRP